MQSGAGVQRSGTPAQSKHPYLRTPAAGIGYTNSEPAAEEQLHRVMQPA